MKKLMKKLTSALIVCILLFTAYAPIADAGVKTNEKRGIIPMYNPNGGGILASIALVVNTRIETSPPSVPNPDYLSVQFFVSTSTLKNSFKQCGGTLTTVTPAKLGSTSISMSKDNGAFVGNSNHVYSRYKSTKQGRLKGTYTVTTAGQFTPTGSMCSGGGRVTSTFSFSNY